MQNLLKKVLMSVFFLQMLINAAPLFAQNMSRGDYETEPMQILEAVKDQANKDYKIQETALDNINDQEGGYDSDYKIANTLDYIRNNIYPYLQRAVYIGLSAAVILLIYNGFLLVTNAAHKAGDLSKVKKNITYIAIGVLLLTGFYFILKVTVSLITSIFGGYNGESGF